MLQNNIIGCHAYECMEGGGGRSMVLDVNKEFCVGRVNVKENKWEKKPI